jgi:DNA-binding transcriptional MerR regulator
MLKVGELAALAGLTVRTLHHYDSIGLLQPSARSDAGYRLYDRNDVARLQQIQALRAFGMSLADIGLALDNPDHSPLTTIDRQLAELDARISADSRLRDQLRIVRGQLAGGAAPDLSTWLTTLEMTMEHLKTYEKYFTPEELERLPMYRDDAVRSQWRALVEQAQGLVALEENLTEHARRPRSRTGRRIVVQL